MPSTLADQQAALPDESNTSFFSQPDGLGVHRNTYRIFCILIAILSPAFGIMYFFSDPQAFDPLWGRLFLSVLALLLLGLSYVSSWIKKHLIGFVHSLFYLLTGWFVFIAALNRFSPNYALGVLFAVTAIGVAFSLGVNRIPPLARYLLFTMAITLPVIFALPLLDVSRPILATSISSTTLVIFIVARSKIQAEAAVAASEDRYHTLMHSANDAIFIADPVSGLILDANRKAQDLVGYPLKELRKMHQSELFPADKQSEYASRLEKHVFEGTAIAEDLYVQHRDGETTPVDISASLIDVDDKQLIQGIFRDVTDRHRYEEQLIQAKDRAEELLKLKNTFLNNMSHELRTPLTSILGFARILKDEARGEQQEYAQTINDSAERLQTTLDSVLDLVQLESGETSLETEQVDVVREVNEAVEQLQPLADEKDLDLVTTARVPHLPAEIDRTCLDRITQNLVGNAIKFTKEGRVTVEVDGSDDRVHLRVHDTGIGISEDFMDHLFEEFRQESTGLARSAEGTGLGLAITKRLVDLMGGTIDVASEEGRGSIFIVSLPRQAPRPGPPPAEKRQNGTPGS